MTQENKNLLLRDLCARLPYGVIVKDRNGIHKLTVGNTEFTDLFYSNKCNIKPYLRPMSSMTGTELVEFLEIRGMNINSEELKTFRSGKTAIVSLLPSYSRHIDWLLERHFDFRGLIEKGLAIEVTKDNNSYEEH